MEQERDLQAALEPKDMHPAGEKHLRDQIGASRTSASDRSVDLTATAYERIEEHFVQMTLKPGSLARTQDIQTLVGLGRTPVHQAVRRFSAETLIEVRPRNGLKIAPVDLARERHLATLRRDLTRFVTEAAMRNMNDNARARLSYLRRQLANGASDMTADRFNEIDKSFDLLLIEISRERFLERTLRPLHTLARRTGYLHFIEISGDDGVRRSIDLHLTIMDAVLADDGERARQGCDDLVRYGIGVIDELGTRVDPQFLDIAYPSLTPHEPKTREGSLAMGA